MIGVRGSLVSEYFAEHVLAERFSGRLGESTRATARPQLDRVRRACSLLGPASPVRTLFDVAAAPLAAALGFRPARLVPVGSPMASRSHESEPIRLSAVFEHANGHVIFLLTPWGDDLHGAWSDTMEAAARLRARWCLLFNGRQLRLIDSWRAYSRDHLEFDLDALPEDAAAFALFWALLRAEAFDENLVEEIIALSAEHAVRVCRSLRDGVLEALGALMQGFADSHRNAPRAVRSLLPDHLFEQSLTIVYRILFLLFAEARRLLPTWHAIYRSAYGMETLRAVVERPDPGAARGVWETFQAISRLVHDGCHAGTLVVTPFNGRLFSPARTPLAESGRLDDRVASRAIAALSTEPGRGGMGRQRIAYRDLGVEQLGSVYESVLDYEPVVEPVDAGTRGLSAEARSAKAEAPFVVTLRRSSGHRKATGTFYTPLSVTSYLVRRSLHPLVAGASAEAILKLRIVDPAMGSGAFLVAACRYLACAYERALVAEGQCHPSDLDERDRTIFRRTIAQRSLFGVDLNPMAVQLARLSLWLATLAADRPLTFLDHHLAVGDSLVGASIEDVFRNPGRPAARTPRRDADPGLFDDHLTEAVGTVLAERLRLAIEPGDTVDAVRDKERTLDRLARRDGPLARWKDAADLWCACWFWETAAAPARGVYRDAVDAILGRPSGLPAATLAPIAERARQIARARRFFNWPLEFPEVFYDEHGRPLADAGFDAVVGNPPWDMLRCDTTAEDKGYDRMLTGFARASGTYRARSDGHPNRFQLFVERAFQLARPAGGRIGLVVPWGLFSDRGCAALRHLLFERAHTDSIVSFENTKAIFPIHRSLRFALVTSTKTAGLKPRPTAEGRREPTIFCRLGEKDVAALDRLPDSLDDDRASGGRFSRQANGGDEARDPIALTVSLLARVSGEDLSVPDVRSARDLEILDRVSSTFPRLAAAEGWQAEFGRELNASDDRPHLAASGNGLPVVEGKHLEPFVAHVGRARFHIDPAVADRLLSGSRSYRRTRLAYRDVASATNRVTLIAAMLPADCVTTHTVFCLKTLLDEDVQWFLCGVMNSYVANYLIRMRVTTHVSAGIVAALPVPRVAVDADLGLAVVRLSRQAAGGIGSPVVDRLQALAARAYRLTAGQFSHVLGTFPLVERKCRDAALACFLSLE